VFWAYLLPPSLPMFSRDFRTCRCGCSGTISLRHEKRAPAGIALGTWRAGRADGDGCRLDRDAGAAAGDCYRRFFLPVSSPFSSSDWATLLPSMTQNPVEHDNAQPLLEYNVCVGRVVQDLGSVVIDVTIVVFDVGFVLVGAGL